MVVLELVPARRTPRTSRSSGDDVAAPTVREPRGRRQQQQLAGDERWYSAAEVAELLGVSTSTVNRRIREGRLRAKALTTDGRQLRIRRDELDRYWDSLDDA